LLRGIHLTSATNTETKVYSPDTGMERHMSTYKHESLPGPREVVSARPAKPALRPDSTADFTAVRGATSLPRNKPGETDVPAQLSTGLSPRGKQVSMLPRPGSRHRPLCNPTYLVRSGTSDPERGCPLEVLTVGRSASSQEARACSSSPCKLIQGTHTVGVT
jgi:hypothetical protein